MADWIVVLLKSGYFWGALLTVINTALKLWAPTFPNEMWVSLELLIIAILAVYGVKVGKGQVAVRRAARKWK